MAKLIAFDSNHNLQFEGYCKLSINKLSSQLIIEPKNENFKTISASFQLKYAIQKNLLFVFADFDFLDFCLVFKNEKVCGKVFSVIREKQQQNGQ
uniref:Uncharacterized protein n=1 Tax=Panagrolaimus sp. PS1159 TaxID=55785 RepID=A0AC35GAL9_9BILA